jgi:hypothetical protein
MSAPRRRRPTAPRCDWIAGICTPTHSALDRCPCAPTHTITIDGAVVGQVCPAHAAAAAAHFWQIAPAKPRRAA